MPLTVSVSEIVLKSGDQFTIKASQDGVSYKSNNTDVAIVSKTGVITALSDGNAIITVYNSDGDAVQIKVTVGESSMPEADWGNADEKNGVTVSDAVLVARIAANDKTAAITDQGRLNADITHDGKIDVNDLTKLLKFLSGQSITLSE